MQNKRAIASTFVWIAGIVVIIFLGILIFGFVLFLGNRTNTAEEVYSENIAYPEKAYNLYALLNSKIDEKRIGEKITGEDKIDSKIREFLLKKMPKANKKKFLWWKLEYIEKDVADKIRGDENLLKKTAIFTLENNKNVVLNIEGWGISNA